MLLCWCRGFQERKQRFIFGRDEIAALFLLENDCSRGNSIKASLCKPHDTVIGFHFYVRHVPAYGERHVARKRPGSRRPRQNVLLFACDLEFYVYRRILRIFISLRHFMARERGTAARAPGHDLVILVYKTSLVRC